jgi:hypothetical protein
MAGLGPQGSLQHPTESGTESTDAHDKISELQFRLIDLQQRLDEQNIGLGSIKLTYERIMSQLDNYSLEKQIIHLERLILLFERRISYYSETVSKMLESTAARMRRVSERTVPLFRGVFPPPPSVRTIMKVPGLSGQHRLIPRNTCIIPGQKVNFAKISNQIQHKISQKRGSALRPRDGGDGGETRERQNFPNDRRKRKPSSEESEPVEDHSQVSTRYPPTKTSHVAAVCPFFSKSITRSLPAGYKRLESCKSSIFQNSIVPGSIKERAHLAL